MKLHKKLLMSLKKNVSLITGRRFHVKKISTLSYLLDMKNRIDRTIDAFSAYEKRQTDYLFPQLKKNNCTCFIDIGAHWGHYSMLFASEPCFDQAQIHAFEPDKINRYQFYANLFMNKLQERIIVHEYAISSEESELKFHHSEENNRGKSHITNDGEIIVKAKKLDSLITVTNEMIGIKIDIEGHEIEAISGMTELLKQNRCILQIESFTQTLPELITIMSELGYSNIYDIDSDHFFSNIQ